MPDKDLAEELGLSSKELEELLRETGFWTEEYDVIANTPKQYPLPEGLRYSFNEPGVLESPMYQEKEFTEPGSYDSIPKEPVYTVPGKYRRATPEHRTPYNISGRIPGQYGKTSGGSYSDRGGPDIPKQKWPHGSGKGRRHGGDGTRKYGQSPGGGMGPGTGFGILDDWGDVVPATDKKGVKSQIDKFYDRFNERQAAPTFIDEHTGVDYRDVNYNPEDDLWQQGDHVPGDELVPRYHESEQWEPTEPSHKVEFAPRGDELSIDRYKGHVPYDTHGYHKPKFKTPEESQEAAEMDMEKVKELEQRVDKLVNRTGSKLKERFSGLSRLFGKDEE